VTPLDDRERRYSVLAAAFGAAMSVALWAPQFGERAAVLLALIGVVMSALLYGAARRRSRLLTGVAAVLLAFGPWGFAWLIGLPFLVLAGWLVVRAPRPSRGEPRPPSEPRARRRRPAPAEDGPGTDPRPPPPPRPSKRYTPPQRRD
jgi:hypothetical protein